MSDLALAARKAFGLRLRDLRLDARLTGRELAALSGLHNTKVSRIESGRQNPSEDDIRAWAIACGVARDIPELIAAHREVEQMWREFKQELRLGQKHIQSRSAQLYESTRLLRAYESTLVPGILMVEGYVRASLESHSIVQGVAVHDIEEGVQARLSRQHLVTAGTGNQYSFIIEAGALNINFGGAEVMNEQYDLLLSVATRPNAALGIIPPGRRRVIYARECFYIFDEALVRSEYWISGFRSSRPDQVAAFIRIFNLLREQAVYGAPARELIEAARTRLQTQEIP